MFAIFTKIIDRIRIKNTKMWSGNVISLNSVLIFPGELIFFWSHFLCSEGFCHSDGKD